MEEEAAGDKVIQRLQSVPGVGGPKTAFAFVSYVAAERFENASQVSNYFGLVPRVYKSGETVWTKYEARPFIREKKGVEETVREALSA